MEYLDIVNFLNSKGAKPSASILDSLFFSLLTEFKPCDIFVEAGAYEASASMRIKNSLKNCRVYAFEANPENFNYFKNDVKGIEYLLSAVSNYTGKIIFKQQAIGVNGMIFPKVRGNNSIKTRTLDKETIYNDIEVPCISLNDFFKEKEVNDLSIGMWLDLEGAAYEALTASTDILKNISFLKIEVEDKEYWTDQKLSTDIISFLSNYDLIPIIRDFEGVTVKQYNILFCNKSLINENLKKFLDNEIKKYS
jgi:FkbM family methyltransferase